MRKSDYSLRYLELQELIGKEPTKEENGQIHGLYYITLEGKKILEDLGLLKILYEPVKKLAEK
jgi:predicted transcriptional regulator